MAEQFAALDDPRLERALTDLGRHVAYPPAPNLSAAVRQRLAGQPTRRRPFWGALFVAQRPVLATAMVLVVLAALVLAAVPAVRTTVAERLGLRGVEIQQVPALPTAAPTTVAPKPTAPALAPVPAVTAASPVAASSPTPTPGSLGARLSLGDQTSLEAARAQVAYQVLVPTALGAPDQVYVRDSPPGGQVALIYLPRAGLPPTTTEPSVGALLTAFRGDIRSTNVFAKGLPPGTQLEEVSVNGGRGYWIDGAAHVFFYLDADGRMKTESLRLAANVLLWEQADLTLRLELAVAKDEALRIAATLRQ